MPAPIVRINYESMESLEQSFYDQAEVTDAVRCTLQDSLQHLRIHWTGDSADSFFKDMEETLLPPLDRLTQALRRSGAVTREVSTIFQQAEEEAAGRFSGGASGGSSSIEATAPDQAALSVYKKALQDELEFNQYLRDQLNLLSGGGLLNLVAGTRGDYERMLAESDQRIQQLKQHINDLQVVKPADVFIDRSRYKDTDLVVQQGGRCVEYAAVNLLAMYGVKITDQQALDMAYGYEWQGDRGRNVLGGTLLDQGGFTLDVAEEIVKQNGFTPEVRYAQGANLPISADHPLDNVSTYDPKNGSVPDQAVDSLVAQLRAGNPVYVATTCSFIGQPTAGHAMNVVGGNFDADGKLQSVVVYTNWGETADEHNGYLTIPADVFLQDWSGFGYYMMTIKK